MYIVTYRRPGGIRTTEPLKMHIARDVLDMCDMLDYSVLSVVEVAPEPAESPQYST